MISIIRDCLRPLILAKKCIIAIYWKWNVRGGGDDGGGYKVQESTSSDKAVHVSSMKSGGVPTYA